MTRAQDIAVLSLPDEPSLEDIKSHYRELAAQMHPDHGGDVASFQKLNDAYRRLRAEAEKPKMCCACAGTGKQYIGTGFTQFKTTCVECGGDGKEKA